VPSINSIRISREGVRKFDGEVEEKEADKVAEGRRGEGEWRIGGKEEKRRSKREREREREREKLNRVRKDVIVGEKRGREGGGSRMGRRHETVGLTQKLRRSSRWARG